MKVAELFQRTFGEAGPTLTVHVPGRVNLIGEHIDYHQLPVLPMAINRGITMAYRATADGTIRAVSSLQAEGVYLNMDDPDAPGKPGDWSNYIRAAFRAVRERWEIRTGLEGAVISDLPQAAGLSSSSALLAAFAIALLRVNGVEPTVEELMEVLPEGEQYVGTRGGGMDHAAVLASPVGAALRIDWTPLRLTAVPLPADWSLIVAHSGEHAEKSGALRERYNALKLAGQRGRRPEASEEDRRIWEHVVTEAERVEQAVAAMRTGELARFGELLFASHQSLRDRLGVSTPALDRLVEACQAAGVAGARLTGAGFGGCVLAVCKSDRRDAVLRELSETYYRDSAVLPASDALFSVTPSKGALIAG